MFGFGFVRFGCLIWNVLVEYCRVLLSSLLLSLTHSPTLYLCLDSFSYCNIFTRSKTHKSHTFPSQTTTIPPPPPPDGLYNLHLPPRTRIILQIRFYTLQTNLFPNCTGSFPLLPYIRVSYHCWMCHVSLLLFTPLLGRDVSVNQERVQSDVGRLERRDF